ncbi:MAG: hypothetical protein GX318_03130 [Clostridia bacterium]|nr:hypothetical protein [Clostridia bacterium]
MGGAAPAAAGGYGDVFTPVGNKDDLGRDAFLKILLAQLQNQNPMEPMKDTEFIAQLAQFSTLEQITGVKEELMGLRQDMWVALEYIGGNFSHGNAQNAQTLNLMDKWIRAEVDGEEISGIVHAIKGFNGTPVLMVEDFEVKLGDVIEVRTP